MYDVKVYEVLFEAVSPIAHHHESFGNHAVISRRKVRGPDGSWSHVPAISGDAMRHGLRESAAYAFLDAAGLLENNTLSEAALRLLFAGGMVTGRGDASSVRLDTYREMVDLIPPLALLGGCASNRVIPGRMVCEDALLLCEESAHLIPSWMVSRSGTLSGARSHIEIHQRVRMDPILDPKKQLLLTERDAEGVRNKLLTSEAAHDTDNAIERESSKSSMMPRTFEAVVSGALFSWRVEAKCTSALDVDTFHTMVAAWLSNSRVGGKQGTGFGHLRALAANEVNVVLPTYDLRSVDLVAPGPRIGELFRSHVRERADRAKMFLSQVDA